METKEFLRIKSIFARLNKTLGFPLKSHNLILSREETVCFSDISQVSLQNCPIKLYLLIFICPEATASHTPGMYCLFHPQVY